VRANWWGLDGGPYREPSLNQGQSSPAGTPLSPAKSGRGDPRSRLRTRALVDVSRYDGALWHTTRVLDDEGRATCWPLTITHSPLTDPSPVLRHELVHMEKTLDRDEQKIDPCSAGPAGRLGFRGRACRS
jgi:hypothetical protein